MAAAAMIKAIAVRGIVGVRSQKSGFRSQNKSGGANLVLAMSGLAINGALPPTSFSILTSGF
jgi:hypothetical protein